MCWVNAGGLWNRCSRRSQPSTPRFATDYLHVGRRHHRPRPGSAAFRRDGDRQPLRRHPDRSGCRGDRRHRAGCQREHQSRRSVPVDVRAGSRFGPDIARKGIADPTATILSMALLDRSSRSKARMPSGSRTPSTPTSPNAAPVRVRPRSSETRSLPGSAEPVPQRSLRLPNTRRCRPVTRPDTHTALNDHRRTEAEPDRGGVHRCIDGFELRVERAQPRCDCTATAYSRQPEDGQVGAPSRRRSSLSSTTDRDERWSPSPNRRRIITAMTVAVLACTPAPLWY